MAVAKRATASKPAAAAAEPKVRETAAKADPGEVAAYFESTGLTRKQLAAAVGVSTSVIATVQNPKGDRWSQVRFERAKPLIEAAAAKNRQAMAKAAEVEAEPAGATVTRLATPRGRTRAGRPSAGRRASNRKAKASA